MHWNTWSEFFAMGGYAFYVWTSFGLTVLMVVWELFALKQRRLQALRGARQMLLMQRMDEKAVP